MAALKLDMTVPLGNTGHAQIIIDVRDVAALSDADRAFLADTCAEFCAFAGRVFAPPATITGDPVVSDIRTVKEPEVPEALRGLVGTRP